MGNSIVLPTEETKVPFTKYKQCTRNEVDTYNRAVAAYNSQFSALASWDGQQVRMQRDPALFAYNPPLGIRKGPWIASEVDVFYETDIITYNLQLKLIGAPQNKLDQRMVKVINTPPIPQPPPDYILNGNSSDAANGQPTVLPSPTPQQAPVQPQMPRGVPEDPDKNRNRYNQMYIRGMAFRVKDQNYMTFVTYNPPPAGATYELALKHFMILYEQIRGFWAFNSGNEVFTMEFIAPDKDATGLVKETFENPSKCVDVNTTQENWYFNQIIDIQGKKNLQAEFCKTKGLTYDASNCGIRQCVQIGGTGMSTETGEPETSKLYNYNQVRFSASAYPGAVDNTAYQRTLTLSGTLGIDDIDKYYTAYNAYNFFWKSQYGWRNPQQRDKPYNPPIPPWINVTSASGENLAFLNAITAFNTQAKGLIARLNNIESVNLPEDFGAFPEPPPYPNALYETFRRPVNYVRPAAAQSIPISDNPNVPLQYQIPINQVADIYTALQARPGSGSASSSRQRCADTSGACVLYDEEVSDAAKRLLEDMRANAARRISSAGIDYAMGRPSVPTSTSTDARLANFYSSIRSDILSSVQSMLGLQ